MKTVMKKMFCLLLVAVMLVSAMPVAFAEGTAIECPMCHETTAELKQAAWKNASCEEPQKDAYECTKDTCKHAFAVEVGNPTSHDFRPARCNDPKICKVCGATEGDALGHDWVDTGVASAATCTTDGIMNQVCSRDERHTRTRSIPASHSWNDATCTAPKTCSICGETDGSALGHVEGDVATCTTAQICTRCGDTLAQALNHDVVDGVCTRGCGYTESSTTPCSVCGADTSDGTCEGCWVEVSACQCCRECGNLITNHAQGCSLAPQVEAGQNEVKITVNLNNGSNTITVIANKRDRMSDVIAKIPMTTPANSEVSWYWSHNNKAVDLNERVQDVRVPGNAPLSIYAKYSPLYNGPVNGLTIQFHLNYGSNKMGDPMMASDDAITGTVLKNVNPSRKYYKFAGWYQDAKCTKPVNWRVEIREYDHDRDGVVHLFAKWEYDKSYSEEGEITLMIYLNGKTHSVAKVKDIEDYADDLVIYYDEVVKIVERYYKPISNRDDMDIDGLYTADTWNNGDYNRRSAVKSVKIKGNGDYIIYVMVRDAKEIPSSSNGAKADNSNPKTGDMIMTPVIVLGASATCLAVLFYLNKKRAY